MVSRCRGFKVPAFYVPANTPITTIKRLHTDDKEVGSNKVVCFSLFSPIVGVNICVLSTIFQFNKKNTVLNSLKF